MQPDISIITPWLDHPEFIADYEKAVAAPGVQVIAVDNGSAMENAAAIRAMVQRLGGFYLRNEQNLWFAAANNQGLAVSSGKTVLFLNNDIAAEPGWLEDVRRDVTKNGLFAPDVKNVQIDQWNVAYLEGWCIAAERDVWNRLRGWNARSFKMPYWEDTELCIRAVQMNIRLTQMPWRVRHKKNGTSSFVPGVLLGLERNRAVITAMVRGQPQPVDNEFSALGALESFDSYLRSGRITEGEQAYRNAVQQQPARGDLWMTYGQILRTCGRFEAAINAVRRAMELNPSHAADAYHEMALSLMNGGKNAEAAEAFGQVVQRQPHAVVAWTNLAVASTLCGQFDQAVNAARRAIQIKPDHSEAHVQLSNALLRLGRMDEARAAAEQAIRTSPQSSAGYHAMGTLQLAEEKLEQALQTLDYAQSLDPHNGFINVQRNEARARLKQRQGT